MKTTYDELITTISDEIARKFLDTERQLATRARLLDADIAEITRQIGLETTKKVFEHGRDDLVKKTRRGTCHSKESGDVFSCHFRADHSAFS